MTQKLQYQFAAGTGISVSTAGNADGTNTTTITNTSPSSITPPTGLGFWTSSAGVLQSSAVVPGGDIGAGVLSGSSWPFSVEFVSGASGGVQFFSRTADYGGGTGIVGINAAGAKPTGLPSNGLNIWCNGVGTTASLGLSAGIAFSEFMTTTPPTIQPDTRTSDLPAVSMILSAGSAKSTASTNTAGGNLSLSGGNGATGVGVNAAFMALGGGGTGIASGLIEMSAPAGIGGSSSTGLPWIWNTLALTTTGGTTTLSSAQRASVYIELSGTLSSNATIVFPVPSTGVAMWILDSQGVTFSGNSLLIKAGTSTVAVGSSPSLIFVFVRSDGSIFQK
jgi:hypothetical protein